MVTARGLIETDCNHIRRNPHDNDDGDDDVFVAENEAVHHQGFPSKEVHSIIPVRIASSPADGVATWRVDPDYHGGKGGFRSTRNDVDMAAFLLCTKRTRRGRKETVLCYQMKVLPCSCN